MGTLMTNPKGFLNTYKRFMKAQNSESSLSMPSIIKFKVPGFPNSNPVELNLEPCRREQLKAWSVYEINRQR
jgi:hypothetical protein